MSTREEIQKEVDNNYQFFLKEKDKIPNYLLDKYVLIRKEEFIEYFDSIDDAIKYAKIKYEDNLYSVQKVNDLPINLGFMGNMLNA
ncbi:hypothetical protein [Brachyspira catarrhinii]|uniref:Uncharacterized protein n=1 Tax=Brachyspira catarrhinii TaxID=2528966 RepID=A0ABY2TR66_9SPIR|nr:hypothetical protein [Brachyspira catarrhinii]TKZ35251.1 hypothetical protein EZH24_06220 [Brachyspira catarrhinii]